MLHAKTAEVHMNEHGFGTTPFPRFSPFFSASYLYYFPPALVAMPGHRGKID